MIRAWTFSSSYLFLIMIFVYIFLAGFRYEITTYVLVTYTLVFALLVYLKKIDTIIVTPIFYFIILHFIICNISLLGPHFIGIPLTYSSLLTLNTKLILVFLVLNALTDERELSHFFKFHDPDI